MRTISDRIGRQLQALVDSGDEDGLQVAVLRNGEPVVDAVAGHRDRAAGRPLTRDTPIFSSSLGKNVSAAVAHVLVARGQLPYDTRVVELWPEFGVHGKESTTLRHVLTHTAGLPAMPRSITARDLADWNRVCAELAAAQPRWPAGSAMGYHSYTFGYLVGELARRATGRSMSELLRHWITEPLDIDGSVNFAVAEDVQPRLAHLEQRAQDWPPRPDDSEAVLAPWESSPSTEIGNAPSILRADVPSVATVTAHGLATMLDALLPGALVDRGQLSELSALAFEGTDLATGHPARMALGFPLGRLGDTGASAAFGWPGGGGSYAFADPASGVAFALTKTRLLPNFDTARSVIDVLAEHRLVSR